MSGNATCSTGYEHSGRPELPGAETTLGLHLNTCRCGCSWQRRGAQESWAELIRQVYQAELRLLPHRRYPMARMKQDLGTQRPLFDTTFNFTHFYLLKNLKPAAGVLAAAACGSISETEFVLPDRVLPALRRRRAVG